PLDLGGRLCRVQRTRVGAFSRSFPTLRSRDHHLLPGSGACPENILAFSLEPDRTNIKKMSGPFRLLSRRGCAVGTSPEQGVAGSLCKKRSAVSPAKILGSPLSVARDKRRALRARRHDKIARLPEPGSGG